MPTDAILADAKRARCNNLPCLPASFLTQKVPDFGHADGPDARPGIFPKKNSPEFCPLNWPAVAELIVRRKQQVKQFTKRSMP
jgi:hypothetical protein